jgi:DNA-binding NtrC family response regulator
MAVLERYQWPGNVRELANIVERIAIIHPGLEVKPSDIGPILRQDGIAPASSSAQQPMPDDSNESIALSDVLDDYERRIIERALSDAAGNVAEAARKLQTDRPNLYRRMKRLGLDGVRESERAHHGSVQ